MIANTGDDIEIYGAHVSPDPDLCTFWLADRIDERGWGLRGDTFAAMDALRELGVDVWFNLGDRDLALCLRARAAPGAGRDAHRGARRADRRRSASAPRVLPMSDEPVRTRVLRPRRVADFQEFMIRERAAGPVDDVEFAGIEAATRAARRCSRRSPPPTRSSSARRNPIISIGPILAVPGMRAALRARAGAGRRRLARSSAARCSRARPPRSWPGPGCALDGAGVAAPYGDVLDGLVADEPIDGARRRCRPTR